MKEDNRIRLIALLEHACSAQDDTPGGTIAVLCATVQ